MTLLLLCVGIAVYVKKNQARSYIESAWQGSPSDLRGTLEQTFSCCGLDAWNDTWAVWSQCPTTNNICKDGTNPNIVPALWQQCSTCADALSDEFYTQFNTVGTCGIVFAVLMIFITGFVCCLIRGIHQKNMKHDLGGLHGTDDSAAPTSVPEPTTPGTAGGAVGTTIPSTSPPPVSTQV